MKKLFSMTILAILMACQAPPAGQDAAPSEPFKVIAYYSGNQEEIAKYPVEKLTHIIYSFCHLQGNRLAVDNAADSLTIREIVGLKSRNPALKVLLSLGGWGGCESCSDVFSTEEGRTEFSASVKSLLLDYNADGLDLDWEYPGIEGYPGHPYKAEDTHHFTLLVQSLREEFGKNYELSFAAGGFPHFFDHSAEWELVMPLVENVNIMTYDLVSGFSKVTGHHTPLYSSPDQKRSVDYAIHYLDSLGVDKRKMVIGAAFYGRMWEQVPGDDNGLHQSGVFLRGIPYKKQQELMSEEDGFVYYWDNIAKAPYAYHAEKKQFVTFDDLRSIELKTKYAMEMGLGGIMFWQLGSDLYEDGLLDAIDRCVHPEKPDAK